MIPIPSGVRVWIATGHTDMRRGMASGPRAVYLAFGIGRCGVDFGGSDGLYAGRDRLAKSATDMAAQERRLSQIKYGTMDFRAPQITEFMILSFAWTRLATLCLMT